MFWPAVGEHCKLLELVCNVSVWEIRRSGSGVKQLEFLMLSISCSSHTTALKGRLTGVCLVSGSPSCLHLLSRWSHVVGVRQRRPPRVLPWGTQLSPASRPGSWNGAAHQGFASRPDSRRAAPHPDHLRACLPSSLLLFISCAWRDALQGWKTHSLFVPFEDLEVHIARSQPGKSWHREDMSATEKKKSPSENLLTVLSCSWFSPLSFSHVFLLVLINTIFEAWMRILPAWTPLYNVTVSRL